MLTEKEWRIRTDHRGARNKAFCHSKDDFHSVYIPTAEDTTVKEYIRMRDNHKNTPKINQRTLVLYIRY